MFPHIALIRKRLLTRLANVQTFLQMRLEMKSQNPLPTERLRADLTNVRLVARMDPNVHIVSRPLIKTLGAPFAFVFA